MVKSYGNLLDFLGGFHLLSFVQHSADFINEIWYVTNSCLNLLSVGRIIIEVQRKNAYCGYVGRKR